MKIPTIEEASAFSDAELAEFLGQHHQLKSFKEELKELAELKGEARDEADEMWMQRFTPSVSADSLRWMKEDAIRSTKKGKALLEDAEPSSIF